MSIPAYGVQALVCLTLLEALLQQHLAISHSRPEQLASGYTRLSLVYTQNQDLVNEVW